MIRGVLDTVTSTANYISEDWLPILTFFCNVQYLFTQSFPSSKKTFLENQTILRSKLSLSLIENSLINASV